MDSENSLELGYQAVATLTGAVLGIGVSIVSQGLALADEDQQRGFIGMLDTLNRPDVNLILEVNGERYPVFLPVVE